MNDLKIKGFNIWDLRKVFTMVEAACLLCDIDHKRCTQIPPEAKLMLSVLREAHNNGKLRFFKTGNSVNEELKITRKDLSAFAKKNGLRPKSLFPEAREEHTKADGWRITDFTKWDIEEEFDFYEVAYLYCESDPALDRMEQPPSGCVGYLSAAIADDEASVFYGPGPYHIYKGPIPVKVWNEIKRMYKVLLDAAKKGSLYRPATKRSGALRGPHYKVHRDDLIYFFFNRLKLMPKFLFHEKRRPEEDHAIGWGGAGGGRGIRIPYGYNYPTTAIINDHIIRQEPIVDDNNQKAKERVKQSEKATPNSKRKTDNTAMLDKLPKETTVKEAAYLLEKTERTIRTWCKEGNLPAKKNPGGKDWVIFGNKS